MRRTLLLATAISAVIVTSSAAEDTASTIEHVVIVSVDGLRPELLIPEMESEHPALVRLTRGPHTLAARCDPDVSITMPNHVGMVTGRLVTGEGGHGWVTNDDPPARKQGGTVHARNPGYVASVFDVAHDHGLRTGVICGKWKFVLFEQTWGEGGGRPDTVPPDHGSDKIDLFVCEPDPLTQVDHVKAALQRAAGRGQRSLVMWHVPTPDFQGHATGWDLANGSPYRASVKTVDQALGTFLSALEQDPSLRGRVAVVLTADHGGGVPFVSHLDPEAPVNFAIPFLVWQGRDGAPQDLYQVAGSTRSRPAATERFAANAPPPIRNADAGNTALQLLGLPVIPDSVVPGVRVAPAALATTVP
jgi:predicted AlkP superfamily pyrophosphatase or phosphodiesterase